MPKLVRLPAVVPDDEIRVCWDRSESGDGLHVHAPGKLLQYALSIVTAQRMDFRDGISFAERLRLEEASMRRGRSPIEELEAAGYDPETLVLSIRRKGAAPCTAVASDDLRSRLEEAQASIAALALAVEAMEEHRGVYVLDEREREALSASASEALHAATAALESARAPLPPAEAQAPEDASPASGVAAPRRPVAPDFEKAAILGWEDVDGDGTHWHLKDKERLVGEVYETEAGWRWRCMTSDFRSTETTVQEAKDATVVSHCEHLANEARELLRECRTEAARAASVRAGTPAG